MGAAKSKLATTDWKVADGGVTTTIDGAPPTKADEMITKIAMVKKKDRLERMYDVKDVETGTILYETDHQPGTICWFVITKDSEVIFTVQVGGGRMDWIVYSTKPCWTGQVVDEKASKEDKVADALYRKCMIKFGAGKAVGQVYWYIESDDEPMGKLDDSEPSMVVQEIAAMGQKYQTLLKPDDDNIVGYWDWTTLAAKNDGWRMNLQLAKNTDICLHAIIALSSNLAHLHGRNKGGGAGYAY